MGVESAKLRVELEASWPGIEPVEKAVYTVDEEGLQPVSEQSVDVVLAEEGGEGAAKGNVVENKPEGVEEGVVVELAAKECEKLAGA